MSQIQFAFNQLSQQIQQGFAYFGIIDFYTFIMGTITIILIPGPNSLFVFNLASSVKKLNQTVSNQKLAMAASMGIFLGDCILVLLAMFGVASLLKLYPWLLHSLQVVGAIYLAYIGFGITWHALKDVNQSMNRAKQIKNEQPNKTTKEIIAQVNAEKKLNPFAQNKPDQNITNSTNINLINSYTVKSACIKALLISLSNPKAILFFIAFFPQFIQINYLNSWKILLPLAILMLILQIISMTYLFSLIKAGGAIANLSNQTTQQTNQYSTYIPYKQIILQMIAGILFVILGFYLYLS